MNSSNDPTVATLELTLLTAVLIALGTVIAWKLLSVTNKQDVSMSGVFVCLYSIQLHLHFRET